MWRAGLIDKYLSVVVSVCRINNNRKRRITFRDRGIMFEIVLLKKE